MHCRHFGSSNLQRLLNIVKPSTFLVSAEARLVVFRRLSLVASSPVASSRLATWLLPLLRPRSPPLRHRALPLHQPPRRPHARRCPLGRSSRTPFCGPASVAILPTPSHPSLRFSTCLASHPSPLFVSLAQSQRLTFLPNSQPGNTTEPDQIWRTGPGQSKRRTLPACLAVSTTPSRRPANSAVLPLSLYY